MKVSTERIATLITGRGGLAIDKKRCFLKLLKDSDRKRLFCSNVSTLLPMIVGTLVICVSERWRERELQERIKFVGIKDSNN